MSVTCIMGFQAVKDAYEDFKRHRSDKKENSREVCCYCCCGGGGGGGDGDGGGDLV